MGLTVRLEEVGKTYQGHPVLKGCTYTFEAGGFYILQGDNGSGKSTLLRLAALLEPPDCGEVCYQEGDRLLPPDLHLRRRLTLVFPRVGVFNRSVWDNVAFGLKIRGLRGAELKERVSLVLEHMGLAHKARQPAVTLSSGETMRLGLARALAFEPEVLFLDEPTTHLDRANAQVIEEVIQDLKGQGTLTLVLVTHDQNQARRLGGRKLMLRDGKITEI